MTRYKALQEFEHYPTDVDLEHPQAVVVEVGQTVSNISPESIDALVDRGIVEEVGAKKGDDA